MFARRVRPGTAVVLRGDSLADFIEWVRLRTDLDTRGGGRPRGHAHDGALVQGPGVRLRVRGRHGGDAVPPHELAWHDRGERRGGAPPGLRGHHARPQDACYLTCASQRQIFGQTSANPGVALHPGDPLPSCARPPAWGLRASRGTGWEKRGSRRGIAGSRRRGGGGPRVRPLERLGFAPARSEPSRLAGVRAPRRGQEGCGENGVRRRRLPWTTRRSAAAR